MLSGYLDKALTQEAEQRVRLHLEDCDPCSKLVEDLKMMRDAARATEFEAPADDEWNERRRTAASGFAFGIGWVLLLVWIVAVLGFALGAAWQGSESPLETLLIFGGLSGGALLFLSVLLDRLRSRKTDRYLEVKK